jgi:hypothetical protein
MTAIVIQDSDTFRFPIDHRFAKIPIDGAHASVRSLIQIYLYSCINPKFNYISRDDSIYLLFKILMIKSKNYPVLFLDEMLDYIRDDGLH